MSEAVENVTENTAFSFGSKAELGGIAMGTGVLSIGDKIFWRVSGRQTEARSARLRMRLVSVVRELCPDQERQAVLVEKNTLAKPIVVSEINGVELDALKCLQKRQRYDVML